jgi:hypothetical protein
MFQHVKDMKVNDQIFEVVKNAYDQKAQAMPKVS